MVLNIRSDRYGTIPQLLLHVWGGLLTVTALGGYNLRDCAKIVSEA
jgi:hypothetical protein